MKFAKFIRTPYFTEHLRWLLLNVRNKGVCLTFAQSICFRWKVDIHFIDPKIQKTGGGHHIITLYVSTQGTIFYGIIFRGNVTIWRRRGGGRNEILYDFTS